MSYGYIYLTINKINGKTYIGQKKLYKKAWNEDKYLGSGKKLKCAIKHYGKENFEKHLIQFCSSRDELNEREIFWIAEYRNRGKAEYNIAAGGNGGKVSEVVWNKGLKMSDEWKRQHPNGNIGKHRVYTEDQCEDFRQKMIKTKLEKNGTLVNSGCFKKGCVGNQKGKKYYKNPETKECKMFFPGEQPEGWVLGRYTPWQGKLKEIE